MSLSLSMVPLAGAALYFVVATLYDAISDRRDTRAERGRR